MGKVYRNNDEFCLMNGLTFEEIEGKFIVQLCKCSVHRVIK